MTTAPSRTYRFTPRDDVDANIKRRLGGEFIKAQCKAAGGTLPA